MVAREGLLDVVVASVVVVVVVVGELVDVDGGSITVELLSSSLV